MKKYRLFLAVAAAAVAAAGCSKVKNELTLSEYDPSRVPVSSLSYIEDASSSNKGVFEINGYAAVNAGATSYTIFLATSLDDDVLANNALYQNITVDESTDSVFRVSLSSFTTDSGNKVTLKQGDLYIPMIRANYPPFVHSDWTKIYADGSDRLMYEVGYGMRAVVFEAPKEVTASATDESITASWRKVAYADSYTVEYKKTSEETWNAIPEIDASVTSYTIEGLKDNTFYDVRVKAVDENEAETDYTAILYKTEKTNKFKTKEQLVEFFTSRAASADPKAEFVLMNDIDMEGDVLPSISAFGASFNGQGHAIKNLKITRALFTENNGTISNLILDESCTVAPDTMAFAPLVYINKGTVSGCENCAAVKYESASSITGLVTIAGLVVLNEGTVSACTNRAPVSFIVNGTSESFGIAGLVAVTAGRIENSFNNGKVSCSVERCSAKVGGGVCAGMLGEKPAGCIAGIACYGIDGMKLTGCDNTGAIDYVVTDISGITANLNRNCVAGIMAGPSGDITDCDNSGSIDVKISSSTGPISGKGREYIVCAGGISGGDWFAASTVDGKVVKQTSTNITNCDNSGKITVYSTSAQSNSAIGGIVAWPGVEDVQTVKTLDCVNSGDIVVSGPFKGRFGGVQGGTGHMEGCTNEGNIVVESDVNTASVAGSLCGFHSQTHSILNCNAYGSVKCNAALTGCGGLIGNNGNAANTTGTGCKVDCELVCSNTEGLGLVIGYFNGTTKAITLGTAEAPLKVAGKVNGVDVTADNYTNYIHGTKNYTASKHIIYAEYGK